MTDSITMTSSRPYLLRALHEWINDNGLTPYVVVDADGKDVQVPRQFVENGKIILNISPNAVKDLQIGAEYVMFSARFSGNPYEIVVPIHFVLAIYARENGQGMVFSDDTSTHPPTSPTTPEGGPKLSKERPKLRVVK